jgi:hypothetical protein
MVIAHWHNVQIIDLGGRLTMEHIRAIRTYHSLHASRFPKLITAVTTVRPTVPMSEKPIHDELAKMLKEQQQSGVEMKGMSVVYETRGILGSAIRTVARSLIIISGNRQQIVGSVADALPITLPFVRTSEGETVTRSALEQAISKVRATYSQQQMDCARPSRL